MERRFRLKKEGTFKYVFNKGMRFPAKDFVLVTAPSKEGLKIGFSVSKKCGKAVVRNKIFGRKSHSLVKYVLKRPFFL